MSTLKLRLLAGALAAAGFAGPAAHAQTTLQGGGSSMIAPYWAQAAHCWDNDLGNGTYIENGQPVTPALGICSWTTGTLIKYVSAGSGAGQGATFAHDGPIILFGSPPSGGKIFPTGGIQYGLSDNALGDSDVGVYSVGTNVAYAPPGGRPAIVTPASYEGLTFGAGSGLPTDYPVAKPLYGPLAQFPIAIVPVAIAYNPTYKTGFQLQLPAGQPLKLDADAYCKIFTGAINDWGDAALTALNGPLKDPLDFGAAPIRLVGRSDRSGATSIFTRHLAAACDAILASNPYAAGTLLLPPAVAPLFTTARYDSGVANALDSTAGAIGYVSPSYVWPAVLSTGVGRSLPAAQLKNAAGNYESPTGATALTAFGAISPPTGVNRADPVLWVQNTAKTVALANPPAAGAYPIVGTTNFLGYTCYASVNSVASLRAFLTFGGGSTAATILNNAGLAQLPSNWLTAISNVFVNPTNGGANAGLNLYFAEAGTGSNGSGRTNSNCTAAGVVGG